MGGATERPPVVDDDELWIGSALGGSRNNSFVGGLDEVAVHRECLSPEIIAKRYRRLEQPKPKFVPIPDPTPNAPEPVHQVAVEIPKILEELTLDLSIGEIKAPPGPFSLGGQGLGNQRGSGVGRQGIGEGAGNGDGVFQVGGDVSMPVLLVKTTPAYTDDAIKAKVQGVILLRGVVRSNGQVDTLSIVRGLGYGLEENAIREIATNWKFRPGIRNGEAVDVWATIEVTFNLR